MPCVYLSVRFIDHRTGFLMRLLVAADISCTKDARGFFFESADTRFCVNLSFLSKELLFFVI